MSRFSRVLVSVVTLATATLSISLPARAIDPSTVPGAVAFLASTQLGGTTPATGSGAWDTDPAFAFVTFDAVLAVAEAAQSGATWSTNAALQAVAGFENADGTNPLEFLDLMGASAGGPGAAGKLVVLVAGPLGLPFDAYDPAGDGDPVDLAAVVGVPAADGSYASDLFFNDTLYAALATRLIAATIAPSTVSYVQGGQKADGGWSFDRDAGTTTDADIDTTGLAIQVLVAGGVSPLDPSIQRGLAYLAGQLEPAGFWTFFGTPSVESSSRAMLAVAAAGFDVNSSCWRDAAVPAAVGQPFVPADDALESFAHPDGSIAGPDVFDTSYSTGQGVEGLLRSWLPIVRAGAQTCSGPPPPPTAVVPVAPVTPSIPRFLPLLPALPALPLALRPAFTG